MLGGGGREAEGKTQLGPVTTVSLALLSPATGVFIHTLPPNGTLRIMLFVRGSNMYLDVNEYHYTKQNNIDILST